MLRHGGGYEYRPMDPRITHTVAANLADTKAITLARSKAGGSAFVRPEWVTASLAAGRLLPVAPFLLRPPGMNLPGQRRLFAQARAGEEGGETGIPLSRRDPDRGAAAGRAAAARGVWPAPAAAAPAAAAPAAAPAAVPAAAPAAPLTASLPYPASESAAAAAEALAAAERARAACDLLRGPPKPAAAADSGSAAAAAFVGGFYRASRLHFIGSWRTRFEALAARLHIEDDERGGGVGELGRHPVAAATAPPPPPPAAGGGRAERFVVHLDMDCFFASVSLSRAPAFRGRPLVVCHSSPGAGERPKGRAERRGGGDGGSGGASGGGDRGGGEDDQFAGGEVACPCYLARSFGIRAGMGVAAARRLCPRLVTLPYDFEGYARASDAMYSVLLRCGRRVQPLSVDEALVDASGMSAEQAAALAAALRRAVFEATGGCAASCGVGPNPLLARLATRQAKPDGLKVLSSFREAEELLLTLPCDALPGVGWSSRARLEAAGLRSVAEVRAAGKEALAAALAGASSSGAGTSSSSSNSSNCNSHLNATVQALWDAAHGRDARAVVPLQPRRSVGAECNWGVRFRDAAGGGRADAAGFLLRLSLDLARRLRCAGALPGALTLKVKVRRAGAGLPRKYLGHGVCDAFSKTAAVAMAAACEKGGGGKAGGGEAGDGKDADDALASRLASVGRGLLQSLNPKPEDIRGIGLVASKLVPVGGAARAATATAASPGSAAGGGKGRRRQTGLDALLVPRRPGDLPPAPLPAPGAAAAAGRGGNDPAAAATTTAKTPQKLPQQQQRKHDEEEERKTPRRAPSVPLPCEGWTFDSDYSSSSDSSSSSSSDDDDDYDDGDSESSSESEGGEDDDGEKIVSSSSQALNDVVALSQVDASVFDALPLRLQRELLAGLPKSSSRERERGRKSKSGGAAACDGRGENAAPKVKEAKEKKQGDKKKETQRRGRRRRSAIVPLPRPEELDREVLDALPLPLRWEIERALREEEERGGKREGAPFPPPPPQLRQARLDRSGFLSPPLASAEKKAQERKDPGSSAPRRPPSSRTATPSPSPSSAKRGGGGGGRGGRGGGGGWTTPGSAARRRGRGAGPGAARPLPAVVEEGDERGGRERGSEEEEDDPDFGGVAVADAVLAVAAAEGGAAAPAFAIAAEWARGALLQPARCDAEGALRVARALLRASRPGLSDRAPASASAAAEAARSSLVRVQEAAVECFGAPLLLETRGERLLRLKEAAAVAAGKGEDGKGAGQKGAAATAAAPPSPALS